MESTATASFGASETPNPTGLSPARKRPQGAFKGIGFILAVWVQRMQRKALLPTRGSLSALLAIADVVDPDGRWCFFFLGNLAERCGGTLSLSGLKRAIDDLVKAGLARKLTRAETLAFFAQDIARGRSVHHLPCVLELLIPAEDYPEPVLAEINACREELGEEPLTPHNRPPLKRRRTRAQIDPTPSSDRPTDCFPGDGSEEEVGGSVRDCVSTGEQNRPQRTDGPHGHIAHIPDHRLLDPGPDRKRLGRAADDLIRQGLGVWDLNALFRGVEELKRPFPALMHRMHSLGTARAFLDGSLGRGVNAPGASPVAWPTTEDADLFAREPEFDVDAQGKATGTCPDHPGIRNVPGGTCAVCGIPCRTVPGELMHPPAPPGLTPSPVPEPFVPEPGGEAPPGEEADIDLDLLERMRASLMGAGATSVESPEPTHAYPPTRQAIIDNTHRELDELRQRRLAA